MYSCNYCVYCIWILSNKLGLKPETSFYYTGVNVKNFFGVNLLTLFCKLEYFIIIRNIYDIAMKRYSLQNRVRKFMPKKFYEINPCNLQNIQNKLICLCLASLSKLLKCLRERLYLALPLNITLDCKGLPWTKTLWLIMNI